jgi:hypothetical protein
MAAPPECQSTPPARCRPVPARPGVNSIVDTLPAFDTAHFICAEPRWMTQFTSGVYLLFGCVLAYWAMAASDIVATAILAPGIAAAVLAAALSPANSPIHYASDGRGLYFPARRRAWIPGRAKVQNWLFVPWSNVSRIGVAPLLDDSGKKGVSFCLCASDEHRRLYFSRAAALDGGEKSRIGADHSILVGYPGAFKSPDTIVSILYALQRQPDEDHAQTRFQRA